MGLFGNQFLNVIEWNETRDDILFWKWLWGGQYIGSE